MDKKASKSKEKDKEKSLCHSSARFIDRIFHRFKLTKRSSSSTIMTEPTIPLSEYDTQIATQLTHDEQRSEWEYQKMTPDDLEPFAEQLGKFLQYVQSIQELAYSVHEYPCAVQDSLEKDANELASIYREVKAASVNVQRIKQQRKAVSKEIAAAKKTLHKLRNDETRELEALLQIYDKAMFIRWENLKNTRKPELLRSLLLDVQSKQDALEGLSTMINSKLSNQTAFGPGFKFGSTSGKDKSQTSETGADKASVFSRRRGMIGPQRPYRRRKVPDSQGGSSNERSGCGPSPEIVTISLTPLPPPMITVTPASSMSDRSLATSSSSSLTIVTPSNTDSNSNTHATIGVASEMQTVLQALFGRMRRGETSTNVIETITISDSPTSSVTSTNDNSDESSAMQLFSFPNETESNN